MDMIPKTNRGGADAASVNKIAEVSIFFWLLKIVATTLGETGGDLLAQTMNLGYVVGLGITGALLIVLVAIQLRARRFHPVIFWATIVGTTTAGTEISDMMDRTLGLGYTAGSAILLAGLAVTLAVWFWSERNLSVDPIRSGRAELLFWIAVLFSNSLGTAFGDYLVDDLSLGYVAAAFVCTGVIGVVVALHYTRAINEIALFWVAFVFTRPFGASFGDFLTKPTGHGGLDLGTYNASAVSVALMGVLILLSMRRRLSVGAGG